METVTNIASAASRAIWGEGTNPEDKKDVNGNETLGKEPVAGELGDVKSGEPYDKGNVDADDSTSLPAKSTLTSNPKPTTTETTSDPAAAAVLLPESASTSRDTPTNLLATSDKPSTASEKAAKLPSETTETEALTFTKSDPVADKAVGMEEKASGVKGTTGFDAPGPATTAANTASTATATTTGTGAKTSEGLREETVGSTGLLEEKRVKPESASEPKVGETTASKNTHASTSTPKKSLDASGDADAEGKEKKSLKEKIKEKLHKH